MATSTTCPNCKWSLGEDGTCTNTWCGPSMPMDEKCPVHGEPMIVGRFQGRRRCTFYVPELGVSEDYGCDQGAT